MDELRAFFDNPNPSSSQVIKLRGPLTGGHRITKEDTSLQFDRRVEHRRCMVVSGTDYAREIKEKENEKYLKNEVEPVTWDSVSGGLDSLEQLSSLGTSIQNLGELTDEAMTQVYSKYSFQKKEENNNLAINEYRQEILDQISGYPIVIIEGPTGCGKTTQVPQWILDDAYKNRRPCKIVVTQPRKIAAISIAKRVAQERGWDVGGLVGYQVALENVRSADTRISYVTTGVLLSKLVATKTMNEYTHIILDEVHERGQEMDFLLLVVKKLLFTVSRNVKVILMSATFNRKRFADYFLVNSPLGPLTPSCVKVVKKEPMFTVKIFYLNHLNKFGSVLQKSTPKSDEPGIAPSMYHLVVKLINAFEQIDIHEDNHTDRSEADIPSVLVFLPGINEIEELYSCLTDLSIRKSVAAESVSYKWWVLPLHSTITADEQVRVFQRAPLGHRKIILATNIAESSITVPDIKYVVDFCLMKILVADENTNFTSLQLAWASKTNCEQRAGRAGRVRDGRVYRLVTDKFYDNFQQECPPEMVRCPLERLVLLAKTLDIGPPSHVLALAMDPPDMSNIHRTVLVLKEIGALKKTLGDEWCPFDGDITHLGRIMAMLPLDVRVSKLIMLGYIFGVLDESVIMAAAMSVKNVFNNPFRERLNAYNSKLTWADGSTSDCIAFLNVYKVWNHLRQQQYFKQPGNSEAQWARRFFVQVRALRELNDLVRELRKRLSREGIDPAAGHSPWSKHEMNLILKIILAGAFYPQYFVQLSKNEDREREAVRVLGGLNPRHTVYLKNFPQGQPSEVYATAIKNIVKQNIGDEPRVTFDKISQKVYLSFAADDMATRDNNSSGNPTIPGQVVLPIYKAIKARQLKIDVRIPILPVEKANTLAKALEESQASLNANKMVPRLPDIDDTHFPLKISQLINVGNFWAQYDDESTRKEVMQVHSALNRRPLLAYTGTLTPELLVAAPYAEGNTTYYYRAKILKLLPRDIVEVLYIDYGSMGRVATGSVREVPSEARAPAPLAMRCTLSGVAPAPLLNAHAQWTQAAHALFVQLAPPTASLMAKVYSVTQGVVSLELLANKGQLNINKELIAKGYAIPSEESYESKLNHDLRKMATELNMAQKRAYNKEQVELAYSPAVDSEPFNYKECVADAHLKGPYSPLETTAYSLMYASRDKLVSIEGTSVNSVLLDTAPQEIYQRLLVAGDVGQNEYGSNITLRHTTLMPNIPCLPALIALLFCPVAELRRHPDGSRYVSVLCGLGSTEDGSPHFPEHDLLVDIDADLSVDDIGLMNHIRHLMDYMMVEITAEDEIRPNVPKIMRKDLMELLLKRRKHREPVVVEGAWEWRTAPEEELLEITVPDMVERAVVYPLHAPLELHPVSRERLLELKRDNDELKSLLGRTTSSVERPCKLCGTPPMPLNLLRIHLYSNAHKEKEEDLRLVQS